MICYTATYLTLTPDLLNENFWVWSPGYFFIVIIRFDNHHCMLTKLLIFFLFRLQCCQSSLGGWLVYPGQSCYLPFQIPFSSVRSLSHVWLFVTPWITAHQASLSITISQSSLKLMSIELVMPSSHLILCCPLLLLPPILPSIRVFANESTFSWGGKVLEFQL